MNSTTTQRPYPPTNQTGRVEDHDRPYATYGHLNRNIIAQECHFNLQSSASSLVHSRSLPRFHGKSFAITSWTNVSKEHVMKNLKEEFGIENIQYICIAEGLSELNHRRHLHVQIIFKETIDRRKPFLDEITQTHCNYQVTRNDLAWNEYIKKGGDCIEFNEFKSTTTRGSKQWPSPSSSVSNVASTTGLPMATTTFDDHNQSLVPRRATTVRGQAEAKRQHRNEIFRQAVQLARTNVTEAMKLIEKEMIESFVLYCTWFLACFNYVYLQTQQEADQHIEIDKEYVWPKSFPSCTPQLREAINQWIDQNFFRASRAKCLILIGPTGTGKTSFAMSLPGRPNYCQGRWNLDIWNNYARYSVFDDIPWDDFEQRNYPDKKDLLTQKKYKISATDKYRHTKQINVRQPAIVLLNPENAGSLLEAPKTAAQQKTADYWKERAFIYIMGPDEYFYQSRQHTTVNSNDSPMSINEEEPMGGPYEFERMIQRYKQKRTEKKD